jgi:hypothetical protein
MSFEKSSELIKKFTGIEVSDSLIRSITEESGEKVFRQDIERAIWAKTKTAPLCKTIV